MDKAISAEGFMEKFDQLSPLNQERIAAMQQALIFAQKDEEEKENQQTA